MKLFYTGVDNSGGNDDSAMLQRVLALTDMAVDLARQADNEQCLHRLADAPSALLKFPREPRPGGTVPMNRRILKFDNEVTKNETSGWKLN